jgi:hypothetical protein
LTTREQDPDVASDDLTYVERRGDRGKNGENRTRVGLVVKIEMHSTGAGGLLKYVPYLLRLVSM